MITQKILDKFADAYQTMGVDVEFILAAEVEPTGCQRVMLFYKGDYAGTARINVNQNDFVNIARINNQVEYIVEKAEYEVDEGDEAEER